MQVKRRTDKNSVPKSPQQEIKELKEQLLEKEAVISDLKEQVDLVQVAIDEIILGGMM